jgi:hypothetical protein
VLTAFVSLSILAKIVPNSPSMTLVQTSAVALFTLFLVGIPWYLLQAVVY